ncbi:hypothetical protein NDU88_001666 [Pleurodeles waltl]|uniref:Uncharacterized protein n=1 Tax=Pleurodeles waltl TaxID=8319 RepID=A0AAV7MP35_PLEWA|nr:hypothetical protein NDU88_001666 [Pleurodeles waltl]
MSTYPLFSISCNNAKPTLKAPEREEDKEVDQEKVISTARAGATDDVTIPNTTLDPVVESSSPAMFDLILPSASINKYVTAFPCVPSPSNHSSTCKVPVTFSTEEWMRQVLEELRAIKISQEVAHKVTKGQLSQLNTHLTHLSTRLTQVEQRVSDLEDTGRQA